MDGEPFKNRANKPDIDWGFATVTVLKGANVITAGSMVDMNPLAPDLSSVHQRRLVRKTVHAIRTVSWTGR